MDSPVGIGLLSGEMILRGGCLPHPVVLCGLRELDGKVFAPLIKHKSNVYTFLTTAPLRNKKLGQCCVFDEMAVKRKVARMASVGEHAYDEVADGDVDLIGGLELNAAPVDAAVQKSSRSKRRGVKVSRKIIPKFGSITLERVGLEPWTFTVIFDAGMNNHVFMEATLANFQNLFAFVQQDFDAFERAGGASRTKPQAVKAPRGSQGVRDYWVAAKKRWLTKNVDKGAKCGFRTLQRKGSDDSERAPTAKAKAKNKAAQPSKRHRSTNEGSVASVVELSTSVASVEDPSVEEGSENDDGTL